MKALKAAFVGLIVLLIVGLVVKVLIPSHQPRKIEQFTENTDPESLVLCLRWYAINALGALRPADTGLFILPSGPPEDAWEPSKNKSAIEELAKHGVLKFQPVLRATGYQWYIQLSPTYRTHVWWPGRPYEEQIFLYSPVMYEIVSVEGARKVEKNGVLGLQVDFTWKATTFSQFYQKAESLGLVPFEGADGARPKEYWQSLIGKNIKHSVQMEHGEYGYFIPITREPISPITNATEGEVIYSPKDESATNEL